MIIFYIYHSDKTFNSLIKDPDNKLTKNDIKNFLFKKRVNEYI